MRNCRPNTNSQMWKKQKTEGSHIYAEKEGGLKMEEFSQYFTAINLLPHCIKKMLMYE